MGIDILRTISCATGAQAYNNLSENTTESIFKTRDEVRQLTCRSAPANPSSYLRCLSAMREQRETRCGSPCRTLNVFNQPSKTISFGITDAHWRIKDLFCNF